MDENTTPTAACRDCGTEDRESSLYRFNGNTETYYRCAACFAVWEATHGWRPIDNETRK